MFILIISRGIPTKNDPQWGCFEKDQAEALAALGHKVVVASVDSRLRLYFRKIGITTLSKNNVRYYNSFIIPEAFIKPFGQNICSKLKEWQLERIYSIIEKKWGKPDIIYGHFFFNSYLAIPLCQKHKIPLVTIEHAARFNEKIIDKQSLYQSQEVYKNATDNIAVSQSLRIALQNKFGIDCHVVYNVYGKEFFYQPHYKDSNKITFIATGSLVQRKGFDLLPKAFALLDLPKDKWQMLIIGGGELKNNLQQQIDDTHLHDNIILVGQKGKEDIAKLLNISDVFVLPSRNENFSVAVLEALACGLPVVASICGGIRECIDDKNGMLFEVDDVEGLAKCLKYMFEHYKEYNRKAISDDCLARFSSKVIARQLTEIFENVISQK